MSDESFLLVSLEESKAKKLANAINNESSRKILDYLAQHKSVTETKISKDLGLPMSTVNYNMKQLMEANLVKADEYHYSEKGKEVNHYSLASKYIIIAPKEKKSTIQESLKKIWPLAALAVAATAVIEIITRLTTKTGLMAESARAADEVMMMTAPVVEEAAKPLFLSPAAPYFLIGSAFIILVYFFMELIRSEKAKS